MAEVAGMLKSLKIEADATVVIHSGLLSLGILEGGVSGLFNCIREVLGHRATLVMPAFTLGFGGSREWDYNYSRSEVGALTEFMRKCPGVIRTIHPFHSVCALGPHASQFAACTSTSSFGVGSPFQLLYDLSGYNLSIGTEFEGGTTYLHHTEEMRQVPYRYYKEFPGSVRRQDGELDGRTFRMYARIMTDRYQYVNNWKRVWDVLHGDGLFQLSMLSKAKIYLSRIRMVHERFDRLLLTDPFFAADISAI